MTTVHDALLDSTALVAAAFAEAFGGRFRLGDEVPSVGMVLEGMSAASPVSVINAVFAAKRQIEALAARADGELHDRFERDVGPHDIAARTGCRNASVLLTDVGLVSLAEAGRLSRVGTSTRPRVSLIGERMTAHYPQVDAAPSATADDLDQAEQARVGFATESCGSR